MAKKNVINLDFETPVSVLGIASNEKIWKVCWQINQALNLSLASGEENIHLVQGPGHYYDQESNPDFEFILIENSFPTRKVPRLARTFRFWLVIKAIRETMPDLNQMIKDLSKADGVSLAHDLTEEKDIKKLLP